jgi:hypothetical protein
MLVVPEKITSVQLAKEKSSFEASLLEFFRHDAWGLLRKSPFKASLPEFFRHDAWGLL